MKHCLCKQSILNAYCRHVLYLSRNLRNVCFFQLAGIVVHVDQGHEKAEYGEQKEEDGLDAKAGRRAPGLVDISRSRAVDF